MGLYGIFSQPKKHGYSFEKTSGDSTASIAGSKGGCIIWYTDIICALTHMCTGYDQRKKNLKQHAHIVIPLGEYPQQKEAG